MATDITDDAEPKNISEKNQESTENNQEFKDKE